MDETRGTDARRKVAGAAFLVALLAGIPLTISGLVDLTDSSGPSGGGVVRLLVGAVLVIAAVSALVRERQ